MGSAEPPCINGPILVDIIVHSSGPSLSLFGGGGGGGEGSSNSELSPCRESPLALQPSLNP